MGGWVWQAACTSHPQKYALSLTHTLYLSFVLFSCYFLPPPLLACFRYLFDNAGTVAFALIMSVWSTLFLEFWKRDQNRKAFDWRVRNFEVC